MRYSQMILVILLISLLSVVPVQGETFDLDNSVINVESNNVSSASTQLIEVYAEAANGTLVSGVEVILLTTDGNFDNTTGQVSTIQPDNTGVTGFTNATGYFTVRWTAPTIVFDTPNGAIDAIMNATLFVDDVVKELSTVINVSDDIDSISGSTIVAPVTAASNETVLLQVIAQSSTNSPRSDAQISFSSPLGEFLTSPIGQSDNAGNYSTFWKAPILSVEVPNLEINITASIQAGSGLNVSVFTIIQMSLYQNVSSIAATIIGDLDILEATNEEYSILIANQDSDPLGGAELSLTLTDGDINGESLFEGISDELGFIDFVYAAPVLPNQNNLSVIFGAVISYGNISLTETFELTILAFEDDFIVEWSIPSDPVDQGTIVDLSIQFTSNSTDSPVEEVDVTISTDVGVWVSTGSNSLSSQSDGTGVVLMSLDLTDVDLFFAFQDISLVLNAYDPKFSDVSLLETLTVRRVSQVVDFVTVISSTRVNLGEDVSITPFVSIGSVGVENVSVQLTSSAGMFGSQELLYIDSTSSVGSFTVLWNLDSFDTDISEFTVAFTATILSPNFVAQSLEFNITVVDPDASSMGNTLTQGGQITISGGGEDNSLFLALSASAAIGIGSASAIVIRRRRG